MAKLTLNGQVFDTLDKMSVFRGGVCVASSSEPTDITIEYTGDKKETKGANSRTIRTTMYNRGIKVTGNLGTISSGLIAMAFDATETSENVIVKYNENRILKATDITGYTFTLEKTPNGTEGSEINVIRVTKSTGVVKELTQATVAAEGKFSVSGSTVTFNGTDIAAGDTIDCDYDVKLAASKGTKIVNDLAKTATPVVDVILEGMCASVCEGVDGQSTTTQSYYQIHLYQMQASMNWQLAISDSQTKQPFEFNSVTSKCRKDTIGCEIIVFDQSDN